MKKVSQQVYLSAKEKGQLDAMARKEGVSLSDFVSKLIQAAVKKQGGKEKPEGHGKTDAALDYLVEKMESIEAQLERIEDDTRTNEILAEVGSSRIVTSAIYAGFAADRQAIIWPLLSSLKEKYGSLMSWLPKPPAPAVPAAAAAGPQHNVASVRIEECFNNKRA